MGTGQREKGQHNMRRGGWGRGAWDPDNLWHRDARGLSSKEGDFHEAAMFLLPLSQHLFIEQSLHTNKLCCLLEMEMRRCKPCSQGAQMGRQRLKKWWKWTLGQWELPTEFLNTLSTPATNTHILSPTQRQVAATWSASGPGLAAPWRWVLPIWDQGEACPPLSLCSVCAVALPMNDRPTVKASIPIRAILQDNPWQERHAALPLPEMQKTRGPSVPESQEVKRLWTFTPVAFRIWVSLSLEWEKHLQHFQGRFRE